MKIFQFNDSDEKIIDSLLHNGIRWFEQIDKNVAVMQQSHTIVQNFGAQMDKQHAPTIIESDQISLQVITRSSVVYETKQKFVVELPNHFRYASDLDYIDFDKELIVDILDYLIQNLTQQLNGNAIKDGFSKIEVCRRDIDEFRKIIPSLKENIAFYGFLVQITHTDQDDFCMYTSIKSDLLEDTQAFFSDLTHLDIDLKHPQLKENYAKLDDEWRHVLNRWNAEGN